MNELMLEQLRLIAESNAQNTQLLQSIDARLTDLESLIAGFQNLIVSDQYGMSLKVTEWKR